MGLKTFRNIYQESYKYNLYFALIFEKEELDHVQVYTENITVSTIFYPFKIQNLINGQYLLSSSSNNTHNAKAALY